MAKDLYHPKCGKSFTNSALTGHCGGCCFTFFGLGAFDRHQTHPDGRLLCTPPSQLPGPWWLDGKNRWHYGEGVTEERRTKLDHN